MSPEQTEPRKGAAVAEKISRVMGEMHRLKKTGYNKHHNYQFATDADVSDLVREALHKHKLAVIPSLVEYTVSERPTKYGTTNHVLAVWTMRLVCGETGDTIQCRWVSEALDAQDKLFNKAATSATKYFLLKTFLISTGDEVSDPDASEGAEPKPNNPPRRKQSASKGTRPPNRDAEESSATPKLRKEMGALVEEFRDRIGWRNTELARAAGCRPMDIQRIIAGEVVPDMVLKAVQKAVEKYDAKLKERERQQQDQAAAAPQAARCENCNDEIDPDNRTFLPYCSGKCEKDALKQLSAD